MAAPRNLDKIAVTDQSVPLRTRIRACYKPGMTVSDIQRVTRAPVEKVKKAVQALKGCGFISADVTHNKPGDAMRQAFKQPLVTADMRAAHSKAVPEDMAAE